jgi:hypothetical protein
MCVIYQMNLSVEQQNILNVVKTGKNVVVDAVAGTGKTTLILSIAKELSDKKILQMTYNKSLKFEVREKIRDAGLENLQVHTYHSLAVAYYSDDAFVDNELRKIIKCNTRPKKEIPKVDVFVLDESQDMTYLYFQLMVKYLNDMKHNVQLLILGDYMQGLYEFKGSDIRYLTFGDLLWYKHPLLTTQDFEMCTMKMSYRITNQMRHFVNNVLLGEERMNSCRDDEQVHYIRNSQRNIERIVYAEILRLFEMGVKASDIFVLGPSVKGERSNIRKLENMLVGKNIPCHVPMFDSNNIDQRVINGKIVFSTFHSVKGRQRNYVFVVGFDHSYFKFYARNLPNDVCPNTIYVACTRARKGLYVLENDTSPYDRPIDFIKMDHLKMKEQDYIKFRGVHKTYFQVEEEAEIQTVAKVTPTDLIKFIPDETYHKICEMLDEMFITNEKSNYMIEMPSIIETKSGYFEEISDLNGIAIPAIYYDFLRSVWCNKEIDNIKDSVLYELINMNLENIKTKKKQFLENMIEKLPEKITGMKEYLFMANINLAIQESLYFKLNQIEEYDWLEEDIGVLCKDKFREIIGEDCQHKMPSIESYIIDFSDDETHKKIDEITENYITDKKFRFSARADLITETVLWELKCCAQITMDHKLQLAIYAWLYNIKNDDEKEFKLYNVKNGELYTLTNDMNKLNEIMELLLCSRFNEVIRKPDKMFMEDCHNFIEESARLSG